MSDTMILWWGGRTRREQQMLIGMMLALGLFLGWLLLVRPLYQWREDAERRRAVAESDWSAVQRFAADQAGPAPHDGQAPMALADIEQVARQGAEAVGLAMTLSVDDGGGMAFSAPGATSAQLLGWLATLQAEHGVEAPILSVTENADATLNAQGVLKGRR